MDAFITIIITLVVYSMIATFAYIISKDTEEVAIAFGLGIFGLTLCGVLIVIRKINNKFKYHIGKRSIFEEESTGNKYKCRVADANDVEWMSGYKIVKRYAIKSEWVDIPDFSEEFIEKSKINCDHCKYNNDNMCMCDYPYDGVRCKHDEYGVVLEFNKFEKK
jgi:hypothetical protein